MAVAESTSSIKLITLVAISRLIKNGGRVIQTDRPQELISYLRDNGLRR